jgi:hypothetical protein
VKIGLRGGFALRQKLTYSALGQNLCVVCIGTYAVNAALFKLSLADYNAVLAWLRPPSVGARAKGLVFSDRAARGEASGENSRGGEGTGLAWAREPNKGAQVEKGKVTAKVQTGKGTSQEGSAQKQDAGTDGKDEKDRGSTDAEAGKDGVQS